MRYYYNISNGEIVWGIPKKTAEENDNLLYLPASEAYSRMWFYIEIAVGDKIATSLADLRNRYSVEEIRSWYSECKELIPIELH